MGRRGGAQRPGPGLEDARADAVHAAGSDSQPSCRASDDGCEPSPAAYASRARVPEMPSNCHQQPAIATHSHLRT